VFVMLDGNAAIAACGQRCGEVDATGNPKAAPFELDLDLRETGLFE